MIIYNATLSYRWIEYERNGDKLKQFFIGHEQPKKSTQKTQLIIVVGVWSMDFRMSWNVISMCLITYGINFESEKENGKKELKETIVGSFLFTSCHSPTIFLT